MKNIPSALLTKLGTRQGLEPIVIMKVTWGVGDVSYYTQVPFEISEGVFTTETLLSLESINFRGRFDTNTMVSSFNVTLDDSAGLHEARLRTTCYEKKAVSLYIGFSDSTPPGFASGSTNPIGFIEAFLGVISGSVTHNSQDQTISLNLETRVEDTEMGWYEHGVPVPMCFGYPKRVPAAVIRLDDDLKLVSLSGDGVLKTNHDDWFLTDHVYNISIKSALLPNYEVDFTVKRYSDNILRVLGTADHEAVISTEMQGWGKAWIYNYNLYSNKARAYKVPCTRLGTTVNAVTVDNYWYNLVDLTGKWVRLANRYNLSMIDPKDNTYEAESRFTILNKCVECTSSGIVFEKEFYAVNYDSLMPGVDPLTIISPNIIEEYVPNTSLTGQWATIAHRINQDMENKGASFNFSSTRGLKVRLFSTSGVEIPTRDYVGFNNYTLTPGDKITVEGMSPVEYFINCDTYYGNGSTIRDKNKVIVYYGGLELTRDVDYKLLEGYPKDEKEKNIQDHKIVKISGLFEKLSGSDLFVDFDSSVKNSDKTTAVDIIEWAINKYQILNTTLDNVECDTITFSHVRNLLSSYKIYCNFYVESGKNVLDFIREVAWQSMCAVNFNAGKAYIRFLPEKYLLGSMSTFNTSNTLFRSIIKSYTPIEELTTDVVGVWNDGFGSKRYIASNTTDRDKKLYGTALRELDLYCFNDLDTVTRVTEFWAKRYSKPWRLAQFKTDLRGITVDVNDAIELNSPRISTNTLSGTVTNVSVDMEQCDVTIDVQLASSSEDVTSSQPSTNPDYWLINTAVVEPDPPSADSYELTGTETFDNAGCPWLDVHTGSALLKKFYINASHYGTEYNLSSNSDSEDSIHVGYYLVYTGVTLGYTNVDVSKEIQLALSVLEGGNTYPQYYDVIIVPNGVTSEEVGIVLRFSKTKWAGKTVQFKWAMLDKVAYSQRVTLVGTQNPTTPVLQGQIIRLAYDEIVSLDNEIDFSELVDIFNLRSLGDYIFKYTQIPNVLLSTSMAINSKFTSSVLYPNGTKLYGSPKRLRRLIWDGDTGKYFFGRWNGDTGEVITDIYYFWWLPYYTYTGVGNEAHLSGWLVYEDTDRPFLGSEVINIQYVPDVDGVEMGTPVYWVDPGGLGHWENIFIPGDKENVYKSEIPFDTVLDVLKGIAHLDWYTAGYAENGSIVWQSRSTDPTIYSYKRISRVCILINNPGLLSNPFIRFTFSNADELHLPVIRYSFAMPLTWEEALSGEILEYDKSLWDEGYETIDADITAPASKAASIYKPIYFWIYSAEESSGTEVSNVCAYDFKVFSGNTEVVYENTLLPRVQQYDYNPNTYEKTMKCINVSGSVIPAYSPVLLLPARSGKPYPITVCSDDSINPLDIRFTYEEIPINGESYVFSVVNGDCKVTINPETIDSCFEPTYIEPYPYIRVGTSNGKNYLDTKKVGFIITRLDGAYAWVAQDYNSYVPTQLPDVEYPFPLGVLAYALEDIESNRIVKIVDPNYSIVNGSKILRGVSYPGDNYSIQNKHLLVSATNLLKGEYGLFYSIGIVENARTVKAVDWSTWRDSNICNYTSDGKLTNNIVDGRTKYYVVDIGMNDYGSTYNECVKVEPYPDAIIYDVIKPKQINEDGILTLKCNTVTKDGRILQTKSKMVTIYCEDVPFRLSQTEEFSSNITTDISRLSVIYFNTEGLVQNRLIVFYIGTDKIQVTYKGDQNVLDQNDPSNYTSLDHFATVEVVDNNPVAYGVPYKVKNVYRRDVLKTTGVSTEYYADGWKPLTDTPAGTAYSIRKNVASQGIPIPTSLL